MKGLIIKYLFTITLFVIFVSNCWAQVPGNIIVQFRRIVTLIKEDKRSELAKLVAYPLKRQNPVPDINNANGFVEYYPVLFDKAFKKKLLLYNDTMIFAHEGKYGLVGGAFAGEIWLGENGKIEGINTNTKAELALKEKINQIIKRDIYPSVNQWTDNLLVCQSKNLLIRIDNTTKGLRYVAWIKGHSMEEKPDLILYNGIQQRQGTEGGWTWTFKSGSFVYEIDDVELCDTENDCGYFLNLSVKGVNKERVRLTETK